MKLTNHIQHPETDAYLFGRRPAWFALSMTLGLMLFDYIDRQIIVSLFPLIKQDWQLSDAQLGSLVSVISIVVAIAAIPVGIFSDRVSRVKSISAMAIIWSLACIYCMFTDSYSQLLIARGLIGLGEAGYGATGAVLIANHFPSRLRATLLAALFATSALGSVLGVLLGGILASRWGWQSAFGIVGFPGLMLGILYLGVRDYKTVRMDHESTQSCLPSHLAVWQGLRLFLKTPTVFWVCLGAAAQLVVVSAVWSWLPSYLNRYHHFETANAALITASVVLCGAVGCIVWARLVDRAGLYKPDNKLRVMSALCLISMLMLGLAFSSFDFWINLDFRYQLTCIAIGAFVMTCTIGPVSAIIIEVAQPDFRVTGASVLTLFQNLFGLAAGPLLVGLISDHIELRQALAVISLFSLIAILAFMKATKSYPDDIQSIAKPSSISTQ